VYKPGLIGLPDSCQCEDDFYSYNCDSEGFYQNGCYYRLKNAIFDMHYIMAWVAIGVAGMEVNLQEESLLVYFNTIMLFAAHFWYFDFDLRQHQQKKEPKGLGLLPEIISIDSSTVATKVIKFAIKILNGNIMKLYFNRWLAPE